jgi:LPXTG-motif cell wall-anchored protein
MAIGVDSAAAAKKTPPGDPPGNNGTIKVVASDPSDPDPGNEPKIDGCLVWLEFYGFDQGQTADITFTAQPPSGTKELIADKAVPISDDPAGGGQDKDVVLAYNLTSAVQGLKAQPKQGYHIKVRSDSLQAPGGFKQKVFWVKCTPAPAAALHITKAVVGAGTGPFAFQLRCNHRLLDTTFTLDAGQSHDVASVPPGTTCVASETDAKGAGSTRVTETPADAAADGRVKLVRGRPVTVKFTNVFPGATAQAAGTTGAAGAAAAQPAGAPAATSVLGATATAAAAPAPASSLPRTGGDGAALTAVGLWALSAGGVALAGGRRRRRS